MDPTGFVRFTHAEIEQSIPARFARQVASHGDRLAVSGREPLTYRELDHASTALAGALLEARGDRAEPVVLLLRQGTPLVVTILAVLKAGKVYVPLDPHASEHERARAIEASGAGVLIADQETDSIARRHAGASHLIVQVDRAPTASCTKTSLPTVPPDAPAYVFYTSGTTGAPKGVVDSHRNVLHNVMRYTNALRIGPDDRLTLLQGPSFSGTVSSLFSALLNGAAVFPFDLKRESMSEVASAVIEHGVTIWHSVPALFEQLLASGSALPSLRLIRLEGDQASRRHVELFQQRFGRSCNLVNGLGATETGITRQLFIDHDTELAGSAVPLGYGTEDMETLILDEAGAQLAPGEIGEIAIRSRYLALGYWRDPERTSAAFAAAPGKPGTRLYRTGDLGRLRADGCLEYLGRSNFRIKLRGRWVDTDAIEAALLELGVVRAVAVQACEVAAGQPQLVAYVVPADGVAPSVQAIRTHLATRMTADAMPARFVFMAALPLNAHFKVDRNALPRPEPERPRLDTPFASPRDPLEMALVDIWHEVLRLDRVGIHDGFFELGGDLLQALEVAHLIEQRIEAEFPVSSVLEAATIAEMAERVRAARPPQCLVPIRRGGSRTPFFCVHDQSGEILCFRALAEHLSEQRPVHGLRAPKMADDASLRVETLAATYVEALRAVQADGPYLIGGNCLGGVIAYEMAQQLTRAGARVALLVLFDTAFPSGRLQEALGRLRRLGWLSSEWSAGTRPDLLPKLWERAASGARATIARLRGERSLPRYHQNVQQALEAAGRSYAAQPYVGHATLIRVGGQTNQGGWGG